MLEYSIVSRNVPMPRQSDLDTVFDALNGLSTDMDRGSVHETPHSGSEHPRGLAKWQLLAVDRFIAKNMHRRIGTGEVANVAGFSVNYFCRAFRASSGKSPQEHIKELRIERAKASIIASSQSLADVADQCGFADQAHFTRVFKSVTGDAPQRWRGRHIGLPVAEDQSK